MDSHAITGIISATMDEKESCAKSSSDYTIAMYKMG